MNVKYALVVTGLVLASPVFAAGDKAAGEKEFNKCKACGATVESRRSMQFGFI